MTDLAEVPIEKIFDSRRDLNPRLVFGQKYVEYVVVKSNPKTL